MPGKYAAHAARCADCQTFPHEPCPAGRASLDDDEIARLRDVDAGLLACAVEAGIESAVRWMADNKRVAMLKTDDGPAYLWSWPAPEEIPEELRSVVLALRETLESTGEAATVGGLPARILPKGTL